MVKMPLNELLLVFEKTTLTKKRKLFVNNSQEIKITLNCKNAKVGTHISHIMKLKNE